MITHGAFVRIFIAIIYFGKNFLKRLDCMLADFYRYSLFKKLVSKIWHVAYRFLFRRLFIGAFTTRAINDFIVALSLSVLKPIYDASVNIYRGSVFLNMIGLALENSRWI